jgi:hypothetical protein
MKTMTKVLLLGSIALHYVVFVSFVLTAVLVLFLLPWYLGVSLIALIVRVIFSREICPLTAFENVQREKLKMYESTGFLKDYILHPKRTFKYILIKLR